MQKNNPCLEGVPLNAHPPIPLRQFIRATGLSTTTCWRFRKKGWLEVATIAGRQFVTREAIAKFNERATRGDFTGHVANPFVAHRREEEIQSSTPTAE